MQNYIEEVLGIKVEIKKWNGKQKLPLYLRNKREYYVLSTENKLNLLMKISAEDFNMIAFQKQILQLSQYTELDIILWFESISAYQRQTLIKNRISFIVPGSQIYVPEWGICLREYYKSRKEKPVKMTAMSQYLLLYMIYQKEDEKNSQANLAVKLNMSAMKVSRAVEELSLLNLVTIQREGKSKIVKAVARGKELYEKSKVYMRSPIQKRIYVSCEDMYLELPAAGEDALANRSMLNPPKHRVFALDKSNAGQIPESQIIEPKWTLDDKYVEIELWKYDPSIYAKDGSVDVVSLALSFEENDDERIEMQIEEMMEDYKW